MDAHALIAIGTLVAAVTLFVTRWIPVEATALSIPVVLAVTGVIDPPEGVLSGFSSHAIVALGSIFIVGAGLRDSGVAAWMARGLERLGGTAEWRTILAVMAAGAGLSAFMPNAAAVAVLLPVVSVLSKKTLKPASRLMMPLSYAAVLGGTITVIGTTPSLILTADLDLRTGHGFSIIEFTKIGVPVAALGILYMLLVGRRLLPERTDEERLREAELPEELARNYGFVRQLYRMRVVPASNLVGRSIDEAAIGEGYDLDVVLVHRPGNLRHRYLHPTPDLKLEPEDQLYLEGSAEDAWRFAEEALVQFGVAGPMALERILGRGVTLVEVTFSPHSSVIGRTLKDLRFRNRYGLNVISVWRKGKPVTAGLGDLKLELGDAMLVSGPPPLIDQLAEDGDYVVLTDHTRAVDVRRAPLAVALLLVALLPPLFGWLPLAVSAMASALLMVATRCTTIAGAQRSIELRILFLIIGTIPLGDALDRTGVAATGASLILPIGGSLGTPGILLVLYLLAATMASFVNNAAAAVILAPVAWQAAASSPVEVHHAFLAVAFGTSCAFLIPFTSQSHLLVVGPGSYRARDFLLVGAGLTILVAAATVTLLSIV